jgi:RHS repeat-associated protein
VTCTSKKSPRLCNRPDQYSPWGERLSQVSHNTDGTTSDGYYGYNSHTDVETLTDNTGQTKATYGYTAYGKNDTTEFTGIDKPDTTDPTKEPYNAYRFNAKRWDQTSGTYDMGFRTYDPGLNTFTTRDMYNGALADMNLTTNPLTGNRYAFGGGNPTTNIELDGHNLLGTIVKDVVSVAKAAAPVAEDAAPAVEESNPIIAALSLFGGADSHKIDVSAFKDFFPKTSADGDSDSDDDESDDQVYCNPLPLSDGGRTYGGLEEYTDHLGNKGCRATGATANLTKSDRRSRNGAMGYGMCAECEPSVMPDGMPEILMGGGDPQAGHLIGYWGKGIGDDTRNLIAMYATANQKMASRVERKAWTALDKGNSVFMSVVPVYGDNNSAVPTEIKVGITIYGSQGPAQSLSCTVVNSPTGDGTKC